jgi:hypothetical protein
MPESHEILREATDPVGVKAVAAELHLSQSLVYKWCQPKGFDGSGADNPLDRVAQLYRLTGDDRLVRWLCAQANGYLVRNPPPQATTEIPMLRFTQTILSEFSALLEDVSSSMEDDGRIDQREAAAIRAHWERLKSVAESFVVACEGRQYEQ